MSQPAAMQRREFISSSTGLLTGLLLAGSPLAAIASSSRWAVDLTSLSTSDGTTLMAVARTICPHDKLEDAAYALVVKALDADASKDQTLRNKITDGLAKLGPDFAARPEGSRVEALKNLESSEFFQTARLKTIQVLYSTPMAYAYFGYEGEAFSKGGYLFRGFNDLRWLPEVPLEDSGPMPVSGSHRD